MLTLSPTSSLPPSSGMLKSTPKSLRLISVVASKPMRWPPHGSVSRPRNSTSSSTGRVTPLMVSSPLAEVPSNEVELNVIGPVFSPSKKSADRR